MGTFRETEPASGCLETDGLLSERLIRECCRYMGVRGIPDERTQALASECLQELEKKMTPRHIVREFPLSFPEDVSGRSEEDFPKGVSKSSAEVSRTGRINLGCFETRSRDLARNLAGCDRILLLAATIGESADLLIRRYSRLEISKGLAMQAAGAAMIEEYCDRLCDSFRRTYAQGGYALRPRFSPGYGDFPLDEQTKICDVLKTGKTIGVTLTDSLLMMPSKSVTAVIGLYRIPETAEVGGVRMTELSVPTCESGTEEFRESEAKRSSDGCDACGKTDCAFREIRGESG